MKKKEIEKKKKFLILNLIILLLIFVLFFLLIFVESAYTDIGSVEYYRLVAGNEYRFSKYSGIGGYGGYTRIIYSSGLDLFLPLKTNAEWSAFYNYKPSTITFTYPTCEMVGETSWNPSNIYDCSGTNKRCYEGVCRTCGGIMVGYTYIYMNNRHEISTPVCWKSGGSGVSCTTICGSAGCKSGNWDDMSNCQACKAFGGSSCLINGGDNYDPARTSNVWGNWGCELRGGTSQVSLSASNGNAKRVCICNY